MKKIITAAAALAFLGAVGVSGAKAEPSGACGGSLVGTSGTSATVCLTNGPVTGSGTVAVVGTGGGYAVADGDSTNQSVPGNCLDGYAGVQAQAGGYSGPVSSSNGDYAYGPQAPAGAPTVPPCT